ncbi:HHL223Cp [Eremothecium sinecaudum]|uniref:Arp2/3 complex 34 kDa subunit n=1 Tax=Eremothecium sinecaudum TaxID=45286 RepID=A0A109UYE1_9SACH|nr:HHL223Cp [Eremothecium sinecaudum]AMD22547.1 HHL223Cp [Eremothecium sinecaudum]
MLHLKPHNLLLIKTLTEALESYKNGKPKVSDQILSDFDYVTFHIINDENDSGKLYVSIRTKAWESVQKAGPGLLDYLQGKYDVLPGISSQRTPNPGYDHTLLVDLNSLTTDSIVQISLLKIYVMSYVFQLAFDENARLAQLPEEQQESSTVHVIRYRDDENIYIKPSGDRITVIFETVFNGETDKVFGKVFLQEFVDARKRNRSIQSAPQVLFAQSVPLEIASVVSRETLNDKSKRFITFVLFPRHFATPDLQFSSVCQLALFRNYFHYHIKCSKAYMHTRMRHRVNSFIKVLNRAKVDSEERDQDEQRRTITGRKMAY